ncbi:PadR family transcriptional regulator [Marinicella litoralis]|uniref:PadR family transcriptional regulator n=1 Tax=Marinicella litoralis TaxID=644220 RepID=A0A4R6XQL7_9GAMM|nr:PadR family transcriptional regulator [Marinicella litoralis]TDR20709.1 PadR family transcriptional regulator [Marinicella litoralis]
MARKSALETGILNDSAFYILSTLLEEMHGYLIMKTIEEATDGSAIIGPASLYTTLKKLLDSGLIQRSKTDDETTKIYLITKKGKNILQQDINRKQRMIAFAENQIKQSTGDKHEN